MSLLKIHMDYFYNIFILNVLVKCDPGAQNQSYVARIYL